MMTADKFRAALQEIADLDAGWASIVAKRALENGERAAIEEALGSTNGAAGKLVAALFARVATLRDPAQAAIDKAWALLDEAVVEKRKLFQALLDGYKQMAELAHESRMKAIECARSTEERRKVVALLPVLINTINDEAFFPSSDAARTLVELLADTADDTAESVLERIVAAAAQKPGGDVWGAKLRAAILHLREKRAAVRASDTLEPPKSAGGDDQ